MHLQCCCILTCVKGATVTMLAIRPEYPVTQTVKVLGYGDVDMTAP